MKVFWVFFGWKGKSYHAGAWAMGRSITSTSRNTITWQPNAVRECTSNHMHRASLPGKKLPSKSSSSGSGWGVTISSPKHVSPSSMQNWHKIQRYFLERPTKSMYCSTNQKDEHLLESAPQAAHRAFSSPPPCHQPSWGLLVWAFGQGKVGELQGPGESWNQ